MKFLNQLLTVSLLFLFIHTGLAQKSSGNGNVVKEDREITAFNRVDVSGTAELRLIHGDEVSIQVETDENLQNKVITDVEDGVLKVYVKGKVKGITKLIVYLTTPTVAEIRMSGTSMLKVKELFPISVLKLTLDGSTSAFLKTNGNRLDLNMSGAATCELSGAVEDLDADLSGACDLNAVDLEAHHVEVNISGAGSVKVFPIDALKVSLSGAASVQYKGDPKDQDISISGVGTVSKIK